MNLSLKIFLTLLLIANYSSAQKGNLLFHHLTLEDGLSELTNQYVYKDSRGFIWISSINGLNRYDGSSIKVYSPDHNDTTSMYGEIIQSNFYEDSLTRIWFCTYNAINCYDPAHDAFSHYFITDDSNDTIPGYHIFHNDDRNNLWMIVENKGLYVFNTRNKQFRFISPLKIVANRALVVQASGGDVKNIYLYNPSDDGIQKITVDHSLRVVKDTFLLTDGKQNIRKPRRIINDADSVLWISGRDELIRYQSEKGDFVHLPLQGISWIVNLNDSTICLSRGELGVWEYNKTRLQLTRFYVHENGNPFSLLTSTVNYFSKDRDGGWWLSSSGSGLSYAYPGKKKFTTTSPGSLDGIDLAKFIPNSFYEEPDGKVFCSTDQGGLYTLDRNCHVIKEWHSPDVETESRINDVYKTFRDSKNNTWLSTYSGLSVIPPGSNEIIPVTGVDKVMWNGTELNDGRIIFSARTKWLYEVQSANDHYYLNPFDTIRFPSEYVFIHQDSKGILWLGDKLQKLILIDPLNFTKVAEIPLMGIVSHFIEDKTKNIAWISMSSGLFEINTTDYSVKLALQEKDRSLFNAITNMLQDDEGLLWLSSRNHIGVFDPSSGNLKIFNEADGMPDSQFKLYGAYRFEDGQMWFGYTGGITRFYPEQIKQIDIEAFPQITTLLVNDVVPVKKVSCETTNATNISEIQKLTFSFRENTLSFVLNSLEYSAPQNNKVQYMMEGVDKDWIEMNSGNFVRYPSLSPGKFTLLVKAANSDGVYSSLIRKLDITITPPFYKTWWFISLSVLMLLALLVYIVYLNFSKKLELQKMRLRLYENLHDDVGSRLTAIVLSAEDILMNDKTSNPKLERISGIAKSIVSNMRRLVWAIDPENDSMNSLMTKIRHDKSLILDEKINFHLESPPHLKQMIIPGEIRYQITSIINEALNNISKYANAGNVWIHFSKSENMLTMMIRDDGRGFNSQEIHNDKVRASGYGIENMKKRISRVKGRLDIQSAQGQGTTIEVKIPIH